MLMAPGPVGLLIGLVHAVEIAVLAVVFAYPNPKSLVFLTVPVMVIIVVFIVVDAVVMVISSQGCWRDRNRYQQGGAEDCFT